MRHCLSGKQLSRTTSHRKALRRNLAASLIEHGAIRTTEAKAKELRRFVEKLITIARKGTLHARKQVIALLQDRAIVDGDGKTLDKTVVQKLFDEVAPRYAGRPGGYTRIVRLSDRRVGDSGVQVLLQLVEEDAGQAGESTEAVSRRKRRAAKRHEAAADTGQAEALTDQPEPETAAEEPPAPAPSDGSEHETDEEKEE
ncbi:MAG: 50S ribosomal protein L17 [Planctomycetota bacterium]|nr:50S ribosomal protein L17 [Planctomycetota bacterium]